jgi:hypothetical protein
MSRWCAGVLLLCVVLVSPAAEQTAAAEFKTVTALTFISDKELSFDLPKTAVDGKFKIRILVGGVEADTKNVDQ